MRYRGLPAAVHALRSARRAHDEPRRGVASGRVRGRSSGQTLVEFALMFPVFITLFFGMIEFGFMFNAQLSLNFATRDASLLAAEAGSIDSNADCVVLRRVESALTAPTNRARVLRVHIFQADVTGHPTGLEQVYTRGGSTPCTTGANVPYSLTTNTFPFLSRCARLEGCGTDSSDPLDTIGVAIEYQYTYVTPMPYLIGGSSAGQTLTGSNSMRMEPYTL
jgi:Flp pilus assembly protein TadG